MTVNYPLTNLISLPAGKSGKMKIVQEGYEAGKEFTVVSLRTSIMTGQQQAKYVADRLGTIHKLKEEGNTWMSDLPCEIYQHMKFVPLLKGDILVGGLGLGLILKMLEFNSEVKSVTIVEKSQDVINLVWPNLSLRYPATVVNDDLFEFLKKCKTENRKMLKRKFDSAYYDIWACDSGLVWYEYIEPLRELSKGIISQKNIHCWQEDVISSQRWK